MSEPFNVNMNIPHSRSNDTAASSFPIRSQPHRSLSPFSRTPTKRESADDGGDASQSQGRSTSEPRSSLKLAPSSTDTYNDMTIATPNTTSDNTTSSANAASGATSKYESDDTIRNTSRHSNTSTGSSEDEVVKQAREAALQAAQQIKKTAHQAQSGFHISLPQIQLGPHGLSLQKQDSGRAPMIVGDMQQRKLIEKKLKQHELLKLQKEKEKMEKDKETLIEPFKHVAEKLEGFIQESQQKIDDMMQQKKHQQQDKDNDSYSSGDDDANNGNRQLRSIAPLPSSGQDDQATVSAIVWKRRSGYGKYSATKAWEKRKIVLRGSVIQYFKVMESEKNVTMGTTTSTAAATTSLPNSTNPSMSLSRPGSPLDPATEGGVNAGANASADVSPTARAAEFTSTSPTTTATNPSAATSHVSKPKKNFWDQAKENLSKAQENINKNIQQHMPHPGNSGNNGDTSSDKHPSESASSSKYQKARGQIDLISENAIVAAMNNADSSVPSGGNNNTATAAESNTASTSASASSSFTPSSILHSVNITNYAPSLTISTPPTPFGISIMVKNETTAKWKICFLSQKEQMEWLALLTSVIVSKSVDVCNQDLLQKRGITGNITERGMLGSSPRASMSGGDGSNGVGDDGAISTAAVGQSQSSEEQGQEPLWKMEEQYSTGSILRAVSYGNAAGFNDAPTPTAQSASLAHRDNMDANTTEEDDSVKEESTAELESSPLAILKEYIHMGSTMGPSLCVARTNLCVLMGMFNISLFIIKSMESRVMFRFVVIFLNLILWLLVVEEDDEHEKVKGSTNKKTKKRINPLLVYLEQYQEGGKAKNGNKVKKTKPYSKPAMRKSTGSRNVTSDMTHPDSSRPQAQDRSISTTAESSPTPRGEDFKPVAGSTSRQLEEGEDEETLVGNLLRWSPLPWDEVMVRSHGYLKSRKKMASPGSMYEIIGCDGLIDDARVPEIISKVQLPTNVLREFEEERVSDGERTWHSPDFFVASIAIPTEEPSLTRPTTDGGGLTCAVYYKMKKETREVLKRITAPGYDSENDPDLINPSNDVQSNIIPAIRLWEKWCRTSPHDEKMQGRFKLIPNIHNPREVGLPSWISKYCGKPVLIKRADVTGFLSSHPNLHAMEFDITLHPFPYLAKKAMAYLHANVFAKAIVSLTYVVEGRDDDELPEVVIGDGARLIYPDPALVCSGDDFFKGIGKSYENGLKFLSKPATELSNSSGTGATDNSDIVISGDEGTRPPEPLVTEENIARDRSLDPARTIEDLDGDVDTDTAVS